MKKHAICLVICLAVASSLHALGGLGGGLAPLSPLVPGGSQNGGKKSDKGQLAISLGYAGVLATSTSYVSDYDIYGYGYSGYHYKTETEYGNLFDLGLRYTFANKLNLFLNGGVGANGSYSVLGGVGYKLLRTEKFDASLGFGFGGYELKWRLTSYSYYSYSNIIETYADYVFAANINLMFKPVDLLGIFAEFDIGGGIFEGFMMMPRVGVSLLL